MDTSQVAENPAEMKRIAILLIEQKNGSRDPGNVCIFSKI
jgi:hypothetical protein